MEDTFKVALLNKVGYFTDDVAAQFSGLLCLHCTQQWLHAILHLSYAHTIYPHGIWMPWNLSRAQWSALCDCCKNGDFGPGCSSRVGDSWCIWISLGTFDFSSGYVLPSWCLTYLSQQSRLEIFNFSFQFFLIFLLGFMKCKMRPEVLSNISWCLPWGFYEVGHL